MIGTRASNARQFAHSRQCSEICENSAAVKSPTRRRCKTEASIQFTSQTYNMEEENETPTPPDNTDLLKCAFCGTITDGTNEFLECPQCGQEGPGCWTQDFHTTFKNDQTN